MKVLFTSLRLFLYLTFVTGIAYPFFITLIAKGRMKPNLIAQKFEKDELRLSLGGIDYQHPVDVGNAWKEINCSECHEKK